MLAWAFKGILSQENDHGWKRISKWDKRHCDDEWSEGSKMLVENKRGTNKQSGNVEEEVEEKGRVGGRHGCEPNCGIVDSTVNKQSPFHFGEIPLQHVQLASHTHILNTTRTLSVFHHSDASQSIFILFPSSSSKWLKSHEVPLETDDLLVKTPKSWGNSTRLFLCLFHNWYTVYQIKWNSMLKDDTHAQHQISWPITSVLLDILCLPALKPKERMIMEGKGVKEKTLDDSMKNYSESFVLYSKQAWKKSAISLQALAYSWLFTRRHSQCLPMFSLKLLSVWGRRKVRRNSLMFKSV